MSDNIDDLVNNINREILSPIIFFLLTAGFLIFIWGLIQFLAGVNDPQKREEGKRHIIWGIIGLSIMLGVVGIINLLCEVIRC